MGFVELSRVLVNTGGWWVDEKNNSYFVSLNIPFLHFCPSILQFSGCVETRVKFEVLIHSVLYVLNPAIYFHSLLSSTGEERSMQEDPKLEESAQSLRSKEHNHHHHHQFLVQGGCCLFTNLEVRRRLISVSIIWPCAARCV